MEFWLGLSTDLVGCREDDGRRKEKKGGDEKHMIGEGRRGERAGGGRRRENIKTGAMVYFAGIGGERSRRIKGAQRERERVED